MFDNLKYPILNEDSKESVLRNAYLYACHKDIEVIKPGNVNINSPHHDTTASDYLISSINSGSELFHEEYSLGDRILKAVIATRDETLTNTNLGIIMLCAPIIHALVKYKGSDLREAIIKTIDDATPDDTVKICKAINISSPGGLGDASEYDTKSLPNVKLREIMSYSAGYDRISYQYHNNFKDILDFILPNLDKNMDKYESTDISISITFLEILSKIPDSHISRKLGEEIAKKTSNHVNDLLKIQDKDCSEDYLVKQLSDLDYEYKKKGINPGTTADLLVASLMIHRIFKSA
jgi:triphosphoribosyl-dephospho-CoA synthase